MQLNDQKKGMLMAFTAVMFITPDSLFIRLANVSSWNLIFYRGFIPFSAVFVALLFVYKTNFIKQTISNGWRGVAYALICPVIVGLLMCPRFALALRQLATMSDRPCIGHDLRIIGLLRAVSVNVAKLELLPVPAAL